MVIGWLLKKAIFFKRNFDTHHYLVTMQIESWISVLVGNTPPV